MNEIGWLAVLFAGIIAYWVILIAYFYHRDKKRGVI